MNSETSSGMGGLMKPVQKAAKASKIKSIKVKVKFGDKKPSAS